MTESSLILFDGVCNLCCGWVMFLIKLDKKAIFQFASLQSETGKSILSELGMTLNEMETVIFIKNKHCFTYSDAILEILIALAGIYKLFKVFYLIPKPIRNFIYIQISKRRYKFFGQRTSCLIPTPSVQKRFIT